MPKNINVLLYVFINRHEWNKYRKNVHDMTKQEEFPKLKSYVQEIEEEG